MEVFEEYSMLTFATWPDIVGKLAFVGLNVMLFDKFPCSAKMRFATVRLLDKVKNVN